VGVFRHHPATTPLSAARDPIPRKILEILTRALSPTSFLTHAIILPSTGGTSFFTGSKMADELLTGHLITHLSGYSIAYLIIISA
jgi:hypothetical protein